MQTDLDVGGKHMFALGRVGPRLGCRSTPRIRSASCQSAVTSTALTAGTFRSAVRGPDVTSLVGYNETSRSRIKQTYVWVQQ